MKHQTYLGQQNNTLVQQVLLRYSGVSTINTYQGFGETTASIFRRVKGSEN
jgi:hypothetical protein